MRLPIKLGISLPPYSLLIAWLAVGCVQIVDEPIGPGDPCQDARCFADRGWEAYQARQWDQFGYFINAIQQDTSFAEAYMGLGYFNIEAGFVGLAAENFQQAIDLDPELVGAYAGSAFSLAAIRDDIAATDRAEEAIDRAGPDFVFEHNESVNARNLRLLLAQLYFRQLRYPDAQSQADVLAPGNGLISGTPDHPYQLMLLLAELAEGS